MSKESIEDLAKKLADAVPEGLKSLREDLEQNFRSVLQSGLSKLDLVTREEFEVQEAVLAKTREKLDALEAKLQEMVLTGQLNEIEEAASIIRAEARGDS